VVLHPPYLNSVDVVVEEAVALSPLLMQVIAKFAFHDAARLFTPSLRTELTKFVTLTS